MDRRRALRLLAASGVGAAATSVTASAAFADGAGSGCFGAAYRPVFFSEPGNLQVGGPFVQSAPGDPNPVADINESANFSYGCGAGGTPLGPGDQNFQWRWSISPTPSSFVITNGTALASASPGWFYFASIHAPNFRITGPANTSYTLTVQLRATCCYGKCANWRCRQAVRTWLHGQGSFTASSDSAGSVNCDLPGPVCP